MEILSFRHKGLKKLYEEGISTGVPPYAATKLRKMLSFLENMESSQELRSLPSWQVHTLTGERKGTLSLSVTANQRLTFRIASAAREIYDVNLEDCH